jgi:outer membrane cobalamin receptor
LQTLFPYTTLFRSTIGGVIGIFTNQATQPGIKTHVNLESGSFKTRYGNAGVSVAQPQGENLWTGQLNVSRMISDGYSASTLGNENDGFEDSSARASLGYQWGDASLVKVTLSQTEIDAQGDEQDFNFPSTVTQGLVIDADQNYASKQQFANLLLQTEYFGWQQQMNISESKNRSRFFDTGTLVSGLNGERSKVDLQTSKLVQVGDLTHSLLIGAQYEGREFENIYPSISCTLRINLFQKCGAFFRQALHHRNGFCYFVCFLCEGMLHSLAYISIVDLRCAIILL